MPLRGKVRYRRKKGSDVRLAFRGETGEVVEAKNVKTGKIHTAREFAADKRRVHKRTGKRKR